MKRKIIKVHLVEEMIPVMLEYISNPSRVRNEFNELVK
jgi:hypothetical protein